MELNLFRNEEGFIELDKLNPEKLEDGEVFEFECIMLLKFNNGDEILFKSDYEHSDYILYSALVTSEIAKQLGFAHADYDLGIYGEKKGVISWNFIKKDEVLILGSEILCSVNKEYGTNYGNNLKDISEALRLYIGYDKKTKQEIINDLTINYYMFDFAVAEEDRNCNNWAIIYNVNDSTYRCADVFDTDRIASTFWGERYISKLIDATKLPDGNFDLNKIKEYSEDSKGRLSYYQLNLPSSYDFNFFCKDNLELAKRGFDIISKIDIKKVFENLETNINVKLPEKYKIWLGLVINYRISLMKEIIESVEKSKGEETAEEKVSRS